MASGRQYMIDFTLSTSPGVWVPLSGPLGLGFDTIDDARKHCDRMGQIYFATENNACLWCQRIVDMATGVIVGYENPFGEYVKEKERMESEQQ